MFLQTWAPAQKNLPTHLRWILKAAKKYNLRWDAISIKPEIARKLPVWFHLGASSDLNKLNNHLYANCLRQVHKVYTVGQLEELARRHDPEHKKKKECPCRHCSLDRSKQCKKPFKCMQLAKEILTCILPKWNPTTCTTPYTLTISPEQFTTIGNDQED